MFKKISNSSVKYQQGMDNFTSVFTLWSVSIPGKWLEFPSEKLQKAQVSWKKLFHFYLLSLFD